MVTDSDQSILTLECPKEYLKINSEDIVIWVDPLDGTSEYTQVSCNCFFFLRKLGLVAIVLGFSGARDCFGRCCH